MSLEMFLLQILIVEEVNFGSGVDHHGTYQQGKLVVGSVVVCSGPHIRLLKIGFNKKIIF